VIPQLGVRMNPLGMALAVLSLIPLPAVAQGIGTVTLIDGSLGVVRDTTVLQGAEGMSLRQGDIIESSEKGFVQLEFVGGAIVALGPSSRMYIFRHGPGGKAGSDTTRAELVLLSGWMKGESNPASGSYRYESPMLAGTTGSGTIVFHSDANGCDLFVESGSAAISEVSSEGNLRPPTTGKAGQFFSRPVGKSMLNSSRPTAAFVGSMPPPFRDTLPSRLARFAGKPVEPKVEHRVSYLEIESWLTMPAAWRRGFVDRFEPRLKDPEFRKQLETHLAKYPEWGPILHPQEHPPQNPPAAVPDSDSPHQRASR